MSIYRRHIPIYIQIVPIGDVYETSGSALAKFNACCFWTLCHSMHILSKREKKRCTKQVTTQTGKYGGWLCPILQDQTPVPRMLYIFANTTNNNIKAHLNQSQTILLDAVLLICKGGRRNLWRFRGSHPEPGSDSDMIWYERIYWWVIWACYTHLIPS